MNFAAGDRSALTRAALDALQRGDWRSAQSAAYAVLNSFPGDADAHFALGVALLEQRQVKAAAEHLQHAMQAAPQRADCAAQCARALSLLQRLPEALAAADIALALAPRDAYSLDTLGVVYSRANAHARAAKVFRRAIELMPTRASYRFNLAASLTFCGEIAAAEDEYEACLALEPRHWRAHSALAQLRRQTPEHNHIARLHALLPAAQDQPDAVLHLHHALAKEYEDLGQYPQAFAHLRTGKSARRAAIAYDPQRDAALFDALIEAFPAPVAAATGCASEEPIFIVGMPRSGTTLVERILSSHPQVHSAGELQNFGVALKRASGSPTRHLLDADTIAGVANLDWAKLGQAYLASTRPGTGHTPRFIDKLPHNFLYLGYIARALPKARLICLRRDPIDTCLSNFRQLFALNTPYFDYAYDLLDTGRYYLGFDRLMAHWQRVLPGRVMEIHYEAIVEDQEAATRQLLQHCGLPWDPACLHFEQNTAPVATASAVQVRAPIYRSALGRWRRYEAQLGELRALLQAGTR